MPVHARSDRPIWTCTGIVMWGLVVLLVLGGCGPVRDGPTRAPDPARAASTARPSGGSRVWLVGHGWHVGLVVAPADVPVEMWPESRLLGGAEYLEVGWGDADFYPGEGTSGQALRAALRSRGSVLHVVAFDTAVAAFFPSSEIVEVELSAPGLAAIAAFVHRAYARDAGGQPIIVAASRYGRGWFYEATGRYGALENSNRWTARALRAAGCPIDPGSIATAGALLEAARSFGRGHAVSGPPGALTFCGGGARG